MAVGGFIFRCGGRVFQTSLATDGEYVQCLGALVRLFASPTLSRRGEDWTIAIGGSTPRHIDHVVQGFWPSVR